MYRYFLIFYVFVCSNFTLAVEVDDLYTAKISVDSQVGAERERALKQAMAVVLVKVGGEASVLTSAKVKASLKRYKSYVTQYRYSLEGDTQKLIASFDEAKVNQLFIDANLPIWGSLRPQLVMWLIEEQGLSRDILSASANSELPYLVREFSEVRGLPILLPLMDLTEVSHINVADLWGRFITPIEQASMRYLADMSVVVRISQEELTQQQLNACQPLCEQIPYKLDWSLLSDGQAISSRSLSFIYQAVDKKSLLKQALVDITQQVYQRYALSTSAEQQFILDVANIKDMPTYVALVDYIAELSSVKSVQLQRAKGSSRRFLLELMGSQQAFLASLKLDKQLSQFIDPLVDIAPDAVPVFIWAKK